ncbi:hypothetical protein D3C86_1933390 [compost metagenome]
MAEPKQELRVRTGLDELTDTLLHGLPRFPYVVEEDQLPKAAQRERGAYLV